MSTFSFLWLVFWITSFLCDVSWSETVSLGSGIPDMLWSVGAIKERLIPGDPKG